MFEDSYLILDEDMCFLNCQNGGKEKGKSILNIQSHQDLLNIFIEAGFDYKEFEKRDGNYYGRKEFKKEKVYSNKIEISLFREFGLFENLLELVAKI